MESNSTNDIVLRDGWTHDADYRRCYQTEDDVETILRLLALTPECRLVDVGCGNGAFAIAAARKEPGCCVWGFDALDSAVAECKQKAAGLVNVHAEHAWAHSIPLASSSVDRILFRSVLHHIPHPQRVYIELGRLLKTGGRLILQAPCNGWDGAVEQVLSDMMMLVDSSHRRFYYRPAEVAAGLQMSGFSVCKTECWPYEFPSVEDGQAQFIRQQGAAKELRLRSIQPGKWSIEGCWMRIIAEKRGG